MFPIFAGNSASTGYNLTRSLRFRASATANLSRTFAALPTVRTKQTVSLWAKRGALGSIQGLIAGYDGVSAFATQLYFTASDTLEFDLGGTSNQYPLITTQVFRDPSAWYHIVVLIDTTQATASDRVKLYVNGSQVTAFGTASYPAQNVLTQFAVNNANNKIGSFWNNGSTFFDGYLTEVNFIDGQALTPSSFGSTNALTGVWQPAAYTGSYGTNGFELQFTDNSAATAAAIGKDSSGNGNNWTPNNISVTAGVTYDSMTDVPTLTSATAANFCVLNPLSNSTNTLSNANISIASAVGNANTRCNSTIAVSSGKWYYEVTLTGVGTNSAAGIGQNQITNAYPANDALSYAYELDNARIGNNNSFSAYGSALVLNDVFMCAFDLDNNKIFFGKNGTWFNSSDPAAGTSPAYTLTAGTYCPIARPYNANLVGASFANNFGQRPFSYTPPTGFVALNTYNLPTNTIVKGNTVMDATLYTGNGSTQTITNAAGFKPDLVWVKGRSNATDNELTDSVRGVTKSLISNSTAAEATDTQGLTAFNSNGFTLGTDANYNGSGRTFVGWQWQAGQGTTSSNTNGTITSTVSVNASAGFSVVTYTGTGANATVGHGLGVAPSWIIVKSRSASGQDWRVYTATVGNTGVVTLNSDGAAVINQSGFWNNTSPTSSVFSVGGSASTNGSGTTYVAYCWTPIAGYSAFGSYTGNGSADGPMIYTGFRPKFVLIKSTTSANDWIIEDTARNTYNVSNSKLSPNTSGAEFTDTSAVGIDFLSNGFKIRGTDGSINTSNTYIYAAFAENPFKNALAR